MKGRISNNGNTKNVEIAGLLTYRSNFLECYLNA